MTAARAAAAALMVVLAVGTLHAQGLPVGTIVEDVKCAADPTQSYALYVPSTYSPDRQVEPADRVSPRQRADALMVEKYQAAAEQYGYIVAGVEQVAKRPVVRLGGGGAGDAGRPRAGASRSMRSGST